MRLPLLATSAALAMLAAQPADDGRSVTRVADGVWVIRHRTTPFEGGNTTVIVGDRDVLVVDACQLPYAAREDIAEIRRLTPKPVRWLVNTHWHNDHVTGNGAYAAAFPGLAIVAHAETKRDMDLNLPNAPRRSAPGLAQALDATTRALAAGTDDAGRPLTTAGRAALEALARRRQAVDDYAALPYTPPTVTFARALDIDLGGRPVRVRHLGRGNTNGDAVVHLPRERIAVVGDLLVHPLPFAYDGYPSEWAATLGRVAALDAAVLVPGHGDVLRDGAYLGLVRDLLRSAVDQVNARLHVVGPAEFRTLEEVAPHVDLSPFRARFAGGDSALATRFDETAAAVVRLAFREAALR